MTFAVARRISSFHTQEAYTKKYNQRKVQAKGFYTTDVIHSTTLIAIDSSSLILLAKTGMLDIAIKGISGKMIMTNKVYEECVTQKNTTDSTLIRKRAEEGAIGLGELKDKNSYHKIRNDFNLGEGETEAIAFCMENNLSLITDDKKAINTCKLLNIPFTTVPNLLVAFAKKGALTSREASAYLGALAHYGRYTHDILQSIKEDLTDEKNG